MASPERAAILNNLGLAFYRRHQRLGAIKDLHRANALFREATEDGLTARSESAMLAAGNWAECAESNDDWDQAASALDAAMTAVRRLFAVQLHRGYREAWLSTARDIPPRAAWAHAQRGDSPGAVMAMEAGRALLLSDALERDRADLSSLIAAGRSELAERFRGAAARVAALETSDGRAQSHWSRER